MLLSWLFWWLTLPTACADAGADPLVDVAAFADPALDGRAPGTAGDHAARERIALRFACLGLTPAGDLAGYAQAFADTANVVAYLPGSDPAVAREIVVIGAHHDHLGGGRLGANDNASGLAGMLAIAAELARGDRPRRTVAFVAYGAEERGLHGSQHYAAHPPAALPLADVVAVVNLDMIGSHAAAGQVAAFGAFRGTAARGLLDRLARRYPRLRIAAGGHSVRGDHLPLCQAGVPYVFLWTPDRRCYHARCDTPARLDHAGLRDIARLAGELARGLADSPKDLAQLRARGGCRPGR